MPIPITPRARRGTGVEEFENDYRAMLTDLRDARPDVRLLLGEPFVVPVRADQRRWREDLDPKIDVVRRLATEFGAALPAFDTALNDAARHADPAALCPDGVHPSGAGHELLAGVWTEAVTADGPAGSAVGVSGSPGHVS